MTSLDRQTGAQPNGRPDLGSYGVWVGSRVWRGSEDEVVSASEDVEGLGYGALWIGGAAADLELPGRILAATQRLIVVTGILNIWTSPSDQVAANFCALNEQYPHRLVLGFGVSHASHLARVGLHYEHPYQAMVDYLDSLDQTRPGVPAHLRLLAALGPRMVRLAAARSAGIHPYLVTADHTRSARTALGVGPLLAPEIRVALDDSERGIAMARNGIATNLQLENYRRSLLRQGWSESDLDAGGSTELVESLVAVGSVAIRQRVADHLAAGADHLTFQVLTGDDAVPLTQWRELSRILRMSGDGGAVHNGLVPSQVPSREEPP